MKRKFEKIEQVEQLVISKKMKIRICENEAKILKEELKDLKEISMLSKFLSKMKSDIDYILPKNNFENLYNLYRNIKSNDFTIEIKRMLSNNNTKFNIIDFIKYNAECDDFSSINKTKFKIDTDICAKYGGQLEESNRTCEFTNYYENYLQNLKTNDVKNQREDDDMCDVGCTYIIGDYYDAEFVILFK